MFRGLGKKKEHRVLAEMAGRNGSIANTLAILHILAVFVSFSVCSVILYIALLNHLNATAKKVLQDEFNAVRRVLHAPNGLQILAEDLDDDVREYESVRNFIRVTDSNGLILLESSDVGLVLTPSVFPEPDDPSNVLKRRLPNGELYLLRSTNVRGDAFHPLGYVVQIAMDISDYEALTIFFRNALSIFIGGGLVIAIVGAVVIVRKGLKPLHDMSEKIHQISERHLDIRLDTGNLPEELGTLATSFNAMLENLERSFERLSRYTGNLAHELRTPIHNLLVEADISLSRERTPDEYRRVIESNMEECTRLARIIDRLLFLARSDQREVQMSLAPVNLCLELEEVREYFASSVPDRDIRVVCDGSMMVYADPVLFRRALSNLMTNAVKYTPAGGIVVLEGRRGSEASVGIEVRDTGVGIDHVHLSRLFERFYRVPSEDAVSVAGTGLGLSIVKAIMELHGGDITIESEPGRGTSVLLRFPVPGETCAG